MINPPVVNLELRDEYPYSTSCLVEKEARMVYIHGIGIGIGQSFLVSILSVSPIILSNTGPNIGSFDKVNIVLGTSRSDMILPIRKPIFETMVVSYHNQ